MLELFQLLISKILLEYYVCPWGTVRLLVERSLIKEVGKKDVPGKPVQFGTTKEFLKFFRLNSIADLPRLDDAESERFELAR